MVKFKDRVKDRVKKFKKNFKEIKSNPKSKRRSLLLGFSTVLGIFGITLIGPTLPAAAKDFPKKIPDNWSNWLCPAPTPPTPVKIVPSAELIKGISGVAAAVCGLAVTSGSFIVGGVCGIVVVLGILKAQGK